MSWERGIRPAFQEKKPLIKLEPETRLYICTDDCRVIARGETIPLAYANWDLKRKQRTRLARYGRWKKRDCYSWVNAGCPEIACYYSFPGGNRQVIGFDMATDEMILRG